MDRQLDTDMMKAVPTPRFDVGENVLAAQLLFEFQVSIINIIIEEIQGVFRYLQNEGN